VSAGKTGFQEFIPAFSRDLSKLFKSEKGKTDPDFIENPSLPNVILSKEISRERLYQTAPKNMDSSVFSGNTDKESLRQILMKNHKLLS
jgi:hypothetical protein